MQQGQFAQFVQDRYPLWLRFAAGLLKLPADSQDVMCVVQQAALNLMTRGGGVESIDEEGANGLFMAAIRNVLCDRGRRQKHHHEYLESTAAEQDQGLAPADLEATSDELAALADTVRELLREAVEQLSPAELSALRAWLDSGGVRSQAVDLLGLTGDEQATRNQYDQPLHRAKRRLQQRLASHYEEASLLGFKKLVDLLKEVVNEACVS